VRETAGIRRFGYPIGAVLELREPLPAGTRFRLLQDGQPIEAQLRPFSRPSGRSGGDGDLIAGVAIDFEGNFLPRETRRYSLELGTDVLPGPEPSHGLKVEPSGDGFRVANGALEYVVPRDLNGLLRSVKTPALEWITRSGRGLLLRSKDGARVSLGGEAAGSPVKARIAKDGPIDCVIVFERGEVGLPGVSAKVDLEIPRSKSWVRVDCTVNDPRGVVTGLEADLELALGDGPTLGDFGAGSLVYATLAKGQAAVLEAGGAPGWAVGDAPGKSPDAGAAAWRVLRGAAGQLEPYVLGPTGGKGPPAEGWAHVMDARRCTAVAVADFARRTADSIEVEASGHVAISRGFHSPDTKSPPATEKRLTFWLHFVDMPPHVGAVTSPQSMQAPLEAAWRD
jgi:hypothetical protein